MRFVGCVGRCLKLAEYPDVCAFCGIVSARDEIRCSCSCVTRESTTLQADVADAACALLANLSGTAGVWGVERYVSYRSGIWQ
jgi:hypothetical protein